LTVELSGNNVWISYTYLFAFSFVITKKPQPVFIAHFPENSV